MKKDTGTRFVTAGALSTGAQQIIRPISHTIYIPVPKTATTLAEILSSDVDGAVLGPVDVSHSEFEDDRSPKLFSQDQLNDLVRDLNLPKDAAELLALRLLLDASRETFQILPISENVPRGASMGKREDSKQ
ncbi:hypothetical protein EVAR_81023_1 [Eumeta japonica]|uniref:Uncharacterized protein n=1 Tax=Eumeta variegata TaxID=151549 RepID=A0A4C1T8J2_EUMVA|nr:hypothetical protein EVAR_81023_1 [Eumeta japonica]